MRPNSSSQTLEELLRLQFGLTEKQILQGQKQEKKNKKGLLFNLVELGLLTKKQSVEVESLFFHSPRVTLKNYPMQPEVFALLSQATKEKYQVIPLRLEGNILTIAASTLLHDVNLMQVLQQESGYLISFVLSYPQEISDTLKHTHEEDHDIDDLLSGKTKELISSDGNLSQAQANEKLGGPVAQAVNFLIAQAVNKAASDIHFEPFPNHYRVRYREDGILKEAKTFDKLLANPFTAALKVKASIDIAESRKPQDGSFSEKIAGRDVDFRVATFPTKFGEKIVIRILDSNNEFINMDSLMLPQDELHKLTKMVESPWGLILVAGPTGSGKTTTLYGMLNHLNNSKVNILTIEDPIEYRMNGVSQAQVNLAKGFNFSSGLRAMMRLDPDVILVGEMRDDETAEIGLQAALTGHMVLSTVHANSASQTVTRLIDLGVEPFIVGSALCGVVSQRLVRRLCQHCREPQQPTPEQYEQIGLHQPPPGTPIYKATGCPQCGQSGYRGRLPLIEVLEVSNAMRAIISKNADAGEIFRMAIENGMRTMNQDARDKILLGLTTIEEYLRVLGPDRGYKPSPTGAKKEAA